MSFSPRIMAEARILAREILDHPEVIELRLPVGSGGGGLIVASTRCGDVLEEFELEGQKFYISLPNTDDSTP